MNQLRSAPEGKRLCVRTTDSAFFGHPEVIPERDIRFEFERDEIALA
jgi:hypothetical protein